MGDRYLVKRLYFSQCVFIRTWIEMPSYINSMSSPLNKITFELSYRLPLPVKEILLLGNRDTFPICPSCNITLEREYQSFCDRCGQRLNWDSFENADVIYYRDFQKKSHQENVPDSYFQLLNYLTTNGI